MTRSEDLAPVPPRARWPSRRRIPLVPAVAVVARTALTASLLGTGVLGALGATDASATAPPGAPAAPAGAAASSSTAPSTRLRLVSQTAFVTGPAGIRLGLTVSSPLPASRLGVKVVLYSRLGSRDAFEETLGGTEPATELPLDTPPTIPLAAVLRDGSVRLRLPVTAAYSAPPGRLGSPTLALDCASGTCPGVYPLEVAVIDRDTGLPLTSLTTYLVYAPRQVGSLPLQVAIVLPFGDRPALSPAGTPRLGPAQLSSLSQLLHVLSGARRTAVTLAVHGQLLTALARSGKPGAYLEARLRAVLRATSSGGSRLDELLAAPFADVDVDELAATGLGDQLAAQLAAGRSAVGAALGQSGAPVPFVAGSGLDAGGLRLLAQAGISTVVIPPSSLAAPAAPVATPTAPLLVAAGPKGAGTTEAFLSDPGLGAAFDAPTNDPGLAAEQFLAELATVYFDDPFASAPRGVVVAPTTAGSSGTFLAAVLAGIASSPILEARTLDSMVAAVHVGANGSPPTGTLANGRGPVLLDGSLVRSAWTGLTTVESVVPADRGLSASLTGSILLGESAGLTPSQEAAYETAPAAALQAIGSHLSLSESRTTLTSRSGRIPVTVQSTMAVPVHVVLRLSSSELTFASGESSVEIPLDLTGKAIETDVRVSTRTSGSSRLELTLLSPAGAYVLIDESTEVRSTAISGIAVALSAGALLVLAVWWFRSSARRRRSARLRAQRADEPARRAAGGDP